ncbi:serine/threonine protein kinase [Intrasporangium calvum]|uniref:non-specific serine/threonine protein kinase n=1 Tax=Intrasporangium calvum TaxID=53358 RepID=A0ABT5GJJ4_9MICO|nr:serine/threonine-protein kinase [Intrasporangium calvum]MDC5698389.1 serine/threonine protein kinase [Intrasporangium calvum]
MSAVDSSRPEVPGHLLDRVIGEGASSVVWSGVDRDGDPVAVKVPRDASVLTPAAWEQERQVLCAVSHEHLVRLREVVALADGRTAFVFDRVTGASVRSMVRARGQLRPGEAVTILTPICEAVAALHAAGGVHGDIAPGNIMLTAAGRPLLLDLGAARIVGQPGEVWGTAGFVATEVREGGRPTSASDIFSLGAVAWFCLTGNGAPDTLQRLDPEIVTSHVGPELTAVVAACIDPDPSVRPSAARLASLFYEAVPAEPVEVVVGADDASELTHRLRAEAALDPPTAARRATRPWRRIAAVTAAASVCVAALVGGGWLLLGPSSAAEAARPPAPAAGPTSSAPSAPAATTRPASLAVDRDAAAPKARTAELLQLLSDRRARALMERDAAGLAAVHRQGSGSHASDVQLIETLLARGERYARVRLTVAKATWLAGDRERATIRARVDWSAYEIVDRAGARATRGAATGELLDFELRLGALGWRIEHINVAAST